MGACATGRLEGRRRWFIGWRVGAGGVRCRKGSQAQEGRRRVGAAAPGGWVGGRRCRGKDAVDASGCRDAGGASWAKATPSRHVRLTTTPLSLLSAPLTLYFLSVVSCSVCNTLSPLIFSPPAVSCSTCAGDPLEVGPSSLLLLTANNTRPVRHTAHLGRQPHRGTFLALGAVVPGGGLVPRTMVVVLR